MTDAEQELTTMIEKQLKDCCDKYGPQLNNDFNKLLMSLRTDNVPMGIQSACLIQLVSDMLGRLVAASSLKMADPQKLFSEVNKALLGIINHHYDSYKKDGLNVHADAPKT